MCRMWTCPCSQHVRTECAETTCNLCCFHWNTNYNGCGCFFPPFLTVSYRNTTANIFMIQTCRVCNRFSFSRACQMDMSLFRTLHCLQDMLISVLTRSDELSFFSYLSPSGSESHNVLIVRRVL